MASGDGLVEVLVEYEYEAEQPDEISLKPGDIVTEVRKLDGGWWEGSIGGKRGVFPDNFVKEISKKHPFHKSDKKKPTKAAPPPGAKEVKEVKKKRRAKVTYSYAAENEDELELKVGDIVDITNAEDDGWWEGILEGRAGVFPSNFVDMLTEDGHIKAEDNDFKEIKGKKIKGIGFGDIFAGGVPKLKAKKPGAPDIEMTSPPIINSAPSHRPVAMAREEIPPPVPKEAPPQHPVERARVLYPYQAENEDELSLDEGNIVIILEKELEDSGWWRGSLNGRSGVFPDNFVELLPAEEVHKPQRPALPMTAKTRPAVVLPPEPEKVEPPKEDKTKTATPQKDSVKRTAMAPPPVGQKPEHSDTNSAVMRLKHPTKDRPKPPAARQPTTKVNVTQKEFPPTRTIPMNHVPAAVAETGTGYTTTPVTPGSPSTKKKKVPTATLR